jgi:diacylglycerol kinase family enzyme
MIRVGIIINANAKKNRLMKKDPSEVYRRIGGSLVDIRLTRSLDELEDVIGDFQKKAVSYIGVSGGDGSLHHALTVAMKVYGENRTPPLVVLKGGTMDNVSRSIHLRGQGHDVLRRLLKKISAGGKIEIRKRGTMRIGDRYCFIFGTGFVTNFLEEVYRGGEKGNFRNIQVICMAFRHLIFRPERGSLFRRIEGRFTADGRILDLDSSSVILAGTVEHVGMGFAPLYRALEKSGSFHALISGLGPASFLRHIMKIYRGGMVRESPHYDLVADRLTIESDSRFSYTMDGDMYEASGRLEVAAGPLVDMVLV